MKKLVFVSSLALFVGGLACSQAAPGSDGSGGKTGSGSGGAATSSGGATGTNSGGATGTNSGGATGSGTGGETTSTGGATVTGSGGATTNSGGATGTASGGATGTATGGATGTGSGGRGTGGSGTSTGGSTPGTGGRATGGAGTNTGGAMATGGAAGGGSGALVINDILPGLDGYYWEASPSGNTALSGTNYPFGPTAGGCPMNATWDTTGYIATKPVLNVRGTTGQKYTVNVHVRGVQGTRCYSGGTPASTATPSATGQNNTWYAGGKQVGDSKWNTNEIRVAPKVAGQPNQTNPDYDVYYTNSFPMNPNWCEKEATYEVRFNASFPVMGGGTITLVTHDSNCRTLGNCGSVENQASCNSSAARTIDMSGVTPAATNPGGGTFTQPRTGALGGTTYYLQWIWIDVTSVTSP